MTATTTPTSPTSGNGTAPAGTAVASCPDVEDGNAKEEKMIRDAHQEAEKMIDSSIQSLKNAKTKPDSLVDTYFGINGTTDEDKKNLDKLIENYKRMKRDMGKVGYEVEHEKIKPGEPYTVAYVRTLPFFHGIGDVHVVFPAFEKGTDEDRATTLVHEISHYSVGTEDHAYQWETAKWSKLTKDEKMDNAENYGDFARDSHAAASSGP